LVPLLLFLLKKLNMEDNQNLNHIKSLTSHEETLWLKDNLTAEEVTKLPQIKSELDQCWDLLRHRRTFRDAGINPDKAVARDIDDIENDIK
jgi:hypothetical protein